jgi:general nucleoside transport system permease protein
MTGTIEALLEATVRTATPLALAALGETVTERAGVINIGLEGVILAGAFGALVGAGVGVVGGIATGVAAGVAMAAIFAVFAIRVRADQIIVGAAVTLLAIGLTGALYRTLYGTAGAALSIPTIPPLWVPLLSDVPVLGRAMFAQTPFTYAVYVLIPAIWFWMYRTGAGLALRAVGEAPQAARAAGIRERKVQVLAILFGGLLGGASGASLVLAQSGTFAEGMSAGRGFIAIAIVVLGRWHPVGAGLAALVFGAATAIQFSLQAMGWRIPYQLFLMLPYAVTLVLLASRRTRAAAPAALGQL